MECGNTGSVEFETVRKEWFEYVLVHIFLFIVAYYFVICIRSSKSAVFIISLSVIFHTIDDILMFQEDFQLPFLNFHFYFFWRGEAGVFKFQVIFNISICCLLAPPS